MSDEKIIALRGAPIPGVNAEPVPSVVEECERMLAAALAGKLRGVNAALLFMEIGYATISVGEGATLETLGSLRMLEFDICRRATTDAHKHR